MIPFADAHHHLWDLGELSYRWLEEEDPAEARLLGDYAAIRRSYLASDYLADIAASGVTASVHVQAAYSGPDPVRETAWLQTIADRHGFPHAIIAYCDLASPGARTQLDRHRAHRNMRGVRTFTEGDALLAGSFQRGITVLREYGLCYEMQIGHQGMEAARRLADLHAHVQFVLEHAGLPMGRDEAYYQAWRKGLGHLAGAPNVAVKVSGLGMTDHAWSVASIRRWVTAVIEAFGANRVMFGSNWPVDSLYSDYRTLADAYRQIVAEFCEAEQHLLLHLNAERIYHLTGE